MTIARVQMPDGRIARFDVPEGTTPEQVTAFASNSMNLTQNPVEAPTQEKISPLQSFNQSALNSVTFGVKPAIEAAGAKTADAARSLFGAGSGKSYDDYLAEAKAKESAAREQNPISSTLGSITGMLGGAAPVKAAKAVIPTMRQMMTGGAKLGSGITAVQQASTTEGDLGEKLKAGAVGGVLGGLTGAALPPIVGAVSAIPQAAKSAAGAVKNVLTKPSPEAIAAQQVEKVLSRDAQDIASLGLGENLLQSGGRGAVGRAEAIATRETPASDKLFKYAYGRGQELPSDLSSTLGKQFQEANYPVVLENIKTITRERARPAYKEAYSAATSINDPKINEALDRVVAAGDWPVLTSEARKIAAYEGEKLGNIEDGLIKSFSTRDLDYMTRALRNLGQATEGMGAMGAKTPIGGMRTKTAGEIRERLGDINPAFGNAVKQYGDDIQIYNAAESGKAANLFGSNYKTVLNEYKNLPNDIAKTAWRVGQAENLHSMILSNPTAALRRFNSPMFSKTMKEFYSQDELNAVVTSLNKRLKETGSLQRIVGNSRTAARQMQQAEDAEMADGGLGQLSADIVKTGVIGSAKKRIGNAISEKFVNTPTQQAADKYVVDVLLSKPFGLAGMEASGSLPKPVVEALIKKQSGLLNANKIGNKRTLQGLLMKQTPMIYEGD